MSEVPSVAAVATPPVGLPERLYSTLAGDPGLRDLVELFVSTLPQRLKQLREMAEQGDWEACRRQAHQLKGAAGSYGFSPLSVQAARVESAIRQGAEPETVLELLGELEELAGRVTADAPPY
jgi:HPt (histidine-containing phosphotransfer) domain-containing protein